MKLNINLPHNFTPPAPPAPPASPAPILTAPAVVAAEGEYKLPPRMPDADALSENCGTPARVFVAESPKSRTAGLLVRAVNQVQPGPGKAGKYSYGERRIALPLFDPMTGRVGFRMDDHLGHFRIRRPISNDGSLDALDREAELWADYIILRLWQVGLLDAEPGRPIALGGLPFNKCGVQEWPTTYTKNLDGFVFPIQLPRGLLDVLSAGYREGELRDTPWLWKSDSESRRLLGTSQEWEEKPQTLWLNEWAIYENPVPSNAISASVWHDNHNGIDAHEWIQPAAARFEKTFERLAKVEEAVWECVQIAKRFVKKGGQSKPVPAQPAAKQRKSAAQVERDLLTRNIAALTREHDQLAERVSALADVVAQVLNCDYECVLTNRLNSVAKPE